MPKTFRRRAATICLLSSHPLVLEELRGLLSPREFRVRTVRLEPNLVPRLDGLALPRASIFVTDAQAPIQAIEMLVSGIQERHPAARQLVMAERFTEANAFPLLRRGVKGLLGYSEARDKLSQALKVVSAGGFWVSRKLLARFVESILRAVHEHRALSGPTDLSPREHEVLEALLDNLANKEIADRLHISERTVKFHVSSVLRKYGVRRRTDLILLWFQSRPPALRPDLPGR